ncbi:benzoate-CoA ligase [Amycolatopsis marina]|uniref:Benzoate-CoA ligase n=1 Tax=Amycolatopsis marina TaxID=490629 RepID=A0A1I0YRQ9_9PSEU|nr:benzoate-CoA ligase family protein [Amycolatopsis marina]SFB14998.1 benzoate-CoA ligase [Amycolatopsis marina]
MNLSAYFLDRNLDEGRSADTALICGDTSHTYAELKELTDRAAGALRELGVGKGDRVLLACSDSVEFVAAWFGAQKIGAVTAEVYTFLKPEDYRYFLRYTEASVVLVDAQTIEPVRQALGTLPDEDRAVVVATRVAPELLHSGEHPLETLLKQAVAVREAVTMAAEDIAIWKFTTGSTGAPKACVHPVRSALKSFECYGRGVLGLGSDDVVLAVPKLFFGYARDLVALFPFAVGGTGIVFAERSTPELIFELIERHGPSILVNVPTMMSAMAAHPRRHDADLSSLRLCTSAGEALPAELLRRWDRAFGVPVLDGIGSSEAYHIYISNRPGATRPGTVGTPVPGYTARIVGERGERLPDGEIGTLEVTGPTTALEYRGAPEKTAETFDGDTVRTGDLFSRDSDGFFTHHGRADELLKVGGIFVVPSEIEHRLIGHPDVVDCAVVGHSDGELVRPWAYVVLREGATADGTRLREFLKAKLPGYKCPKTFHVVDELPRTANGKLDRKALRARNRP